MRLLYNFFCATKRRQELARIRRNTVVCLFPK